MAEEEKQDRNSPAVGVSEPSVPPEPSENPVEANVPAEESSSENPMDNSENSAVAERPNTSAEQSPPLPDFVTTNSETESNSIDLLNDVNLDVKIELGRAEMTVGEILRLASNSVVELDKLAGDPVDVLVNEQLIARGEVLVVNENFCVRINEIISGVTKELASM